MAYDTLKAEIRQYIKTNGANEITGQILQNVLLDMVNAYPSLDGYATQQWVNNQLNDMATMTWVNQQLGNYASQSWVDNNFLSLTGGTLTGFIGAGTLSTGSYHLGNTGLIFEHSYNGSPRYAHSIRISSVDGTITFYGREMTVGTVIEGGQITSNKFIVTNGTSSQFLKADGSVDSNTYLTSSAISDMATQTWVGNNYLPLTGGAITGNISVLYNLHVGSRLSISAEGGTPEDPESFDFWLDNGEIYIDNQTVITRTNIRANAFVMNNGTSAQFLKADGSVDSNTYLTTAILNGYATETWVGNNYLPLTGGALTGSLTVNGNVGIGTSSPTSKLEVAGTITVNPSGDKTLRFGTDGYYYITRGSDGCFLIINQTSNDFIIGNYDDGNYTYFCNDLGGGSIDSSYSQSSRTWNWYIYNEGNASFTSVTQTSDINYKMVTGDVKMSIYNVANAPLFKFTWKDEQKPTGQHIGSAAQYWQTIVPELVSLGTEKNPKMGMQYDVIALASAITIAKTVVDHEQRIAELEKENALLKAKLNIN